MLDAAQAVPYLSTFVAAITKANLTQAFGPTFEGTVIAPQDAGFANLTRLLGLAAPADLLAPEREALLLKVLQYHVSPGKPVNPPALRQGQKLPTLLGAGNDLTVDKRVQPLTHIIGGTPLNVATLLGYQQAGKAVVLVTDQVLLPPQVINGDPALMKVFVPALGLGRR